MIVQLTNNVRPATRLHTLQLLTPYVTTLIYAKTQKHPPLMPITTKPTKEHKMTHKTPSNNHKKSTNNQHLQLEPENRTPIHQTTSAAKRNTHTPPPQFLHPTRNNPK